MPEGPNHTGADDSELHQLRALGSGFAPHGVQWEEPPGDMWSRIEAELGEDELGSSRPAPVTPIDSSDRAEARRGSVPPAERSRSARLAPWLLVAAGVLLIAGIGWFLRDSSGPEVVATTTLEQLGDSGRGTAELLDSDGALQLRLDAEGLEPGDRFVEVWVIDNEVSKLVSLGPLREDGIYDLPSGLDPESFPVVDVSYEPFDGDPAHSGDSVLRGTLEF